MLVTLNWYCSFLIHIKRGGGLGDVKSLPALKFYDFYSLNADTDGNGLSRHSFLLYHISLQMKSENLKKFPVNGHISDFINSQIRLLMDQKSSSWKGASPNLPTCSFHSNADTVFVEIVGEFGQPEAPVWGDWKASQGNHSQRRVEFLGTISCLNKQSLPNPWGWAGSGTTLWDQVHYRGQSALDKNNCEESGPWFWLHGRSRNNMVFQSLINDQEPVPNLEFMPESILVQTCHRDTARTGGGETWARTPLVEVWLLATRRGCLSWSCPR